MIKQKTNIWLNQNLIMKKRSLYISLIISISLLIISYSIGHWIDPEKFQVKNILITISGNYLQDSLINLIFLLPILLLLLSIKFIFKSKHLLIISMFSNILVIISFFSLFIQFKYPLAMFIGIRSGVGVSFLAFLSSIIIFFIDINNKNNIYTYFNLLGINMPIIVSAITPWVLYLSFYSWSHFGD